MMPMAQAIHAMHTPFPCRQKYSMLSSGNVKLQNTLMIKQRNTGKLLLSVSVGKWSKSVFIITSYAVIPVKEDVE